MEAVIQAFGNEYVHWVSWWLLALMSVTILYVAWSLYKNPSDKPNKAGYLLGALLCSSMLIAVVFGATVLVYRKWDVLVSFHNAPVTYLVAIFAVSALCWFFAKNIVLAIRKFRQLSNWF